MTDVTLLKCELVRKGMTVRSLCDTCNLSTAYFYKCLRGEQEFRTDEVKAMAECLGLSSEEMVSIFFAHKVAK